MAFFEHKPLQTRKAIALGITVAVAIILLVLMVLTYTTKDAPVPNESGSKLKNFYTTILSSGQSYFGSK